MPNAIKYSTSNETQALRSGNLYLGVGDVAKGPTDVTGYWVGISPPVSGYTIYTNRESGGPSIYAPSNDTQLISVSSLEIAGNIKNFAYQLSSWVVKRSDITEIVDGSIQPPNSGAKVWQCVVNTTSFVNTLHRIWSSGSSNGIVGSLGSGYYRYYLWVRGKSTNTDTAWINIDISDGKSSGNITVGKSESWQLVQVWDNTSGNYNVDKFFDFEFNNTNGDTFYISSIVIASYNTSNATDLGQLTYNPGYIDYLSTIPVSFPTKQDCFLYMDTRVTSMIVNKDYAPIVTDGLVLNLDASFVPSYPQTGTTWFDTSVSANTSTLANGPTYNSGGWIVFDGVDDKCTINSKPERTTGIRLGPGTTPWMVNVLIRTTAAGSNVIGTFPVLSNQSGGPVVSNMGLGAGGVMKYAHYNNAWIIETGTTVVNTGKWVFLSWVNLNNNTLDMYVNGIFDKNVSSTIGQQNAVDSIGYSWSSYLKADISSLTISTRSSLYTSSDVFQNFYGGNIVSSGLTVYLDGANLVSYPQSGTSWFDIGLSGYNSTIFNGPTFNSENGGFLRFDGIDDYGDVPFSGRSGTVNTIEMFFRWRSGVGGMLMGFLSYDIWTSGGNLGFNTAVSDLWGISSTVVNQLNLIGTGNQNWHHYVFVFADQVQNNKIYIDGVQQTLSQIQGTTNLTTLRSFTTTFRLSGWMNGTATYTIAGDYSIVRGYNRELSASEVLQNYNAQKYRFGL